MVFQQMLAASKYTADDNFVFQQESTLAHAGVQTVNFTS